MKRTFFGLVFLTFYMSLGQNIDSVALKSQVAQAINDLREFVALPSDALDADDIEDNIFWLQKQFGKRGFNTAELKTENLPLFFAALPVDDDKPTVLNIGRFIIIHRKRRKEQR